MTELLQPSANACRQIAMLAFANCEILDVCGPLDVFVWANGALQRTGRTSRPAYSIRILAEQAGPLATNSGICLYAEGAFADADIQAIDTLLIAGGEGVEAARLNPAMVAWLRQASAGARRTASICTGAFLLAASGLLDGRRATTHWAYCSRLAQEYPRLHVEPDRIYVRDDALYTSGGITAGIDLALALVEEDWGGEIANRVARALLVFLRRPGGQSQFSSYLPNEAKTRMDFRELQIWAMDNAAEDLAVENLAARMSMSPRNFSRVFSKEVGMTPGKFVELARVQAASHKLLQTRLPLKAIAQQCGFGDDEQMRRAFQRHYKVSPQDYRARFHTHKPPAL